MKTMLYIDGSHLEGGGQILRTSLGLSSLTGIPFTIENIRKGRCEPGLRAQHLCCVHALQKVCSAKIEGAEIGSEKIVFEPGKIRAGTFELDIGTAGSITLTLQSLLLPLMFSGKRAIVRLRGGTCVKWSQPMDYFTEVLLPQLQRYCEIKCSVKKRGYYPKGGGEVEIKFRPKFSVYDYSDFNQFIEYMSSNVWKIDLVEQGHLLMLKGVSHASDDLANARVAERQADAAMHSLKELKRDVLIRKEYNKTLSTGSGITLWAVFSKNRDEIDEHNPIILGADSLGEKGKLAEKVGSEAAARLLEQIMSGAAVDEHMADNLVPFLIFGGKFKCSKITNHTLTNISVVEKFTGTRFEVDKVNSIIRV